MNWETAEERYCCYRYYSRFHESQTRHVLGSPESTIGGSAGVLGC